MLPFAKAAHNGWLGKLMALETTTVYLIQGERPEIVFHFNGQKPQSAGEMEHLLFYENGEITKMVHDGRLAEVGGIVLKWMFYGGL